jgi:hypothetical protein
MPGEGYVSRFYKVAPYDASVFVTTIMFIAVLAFFAVRSALAMLEGNLPDLFDLGVSILLTGIIVFSWLRSVRGYRVEGGSVIVDRAGRGKLKIPVENISSMEEGSDLGNFVRANMFSSQGLFGWAGKVHVRKPTDIHSAYAEVYGTNPANAVLLHLPQERVVILTPADREGFTGALREAGVSPHKEDRKAQYMPKPKKKKS